MCTNLYDENLKYLESFTEKEKLSLQKSYLSKERTIESNVYDFIYSYIDLIKSKNTNEYNQKLYDNIKENNHKVNLYWGNCLDLLKQLPNESIGLMVTSPPYYNAREYTTWKNLKDYLDDMKVIIQECYRVLDNHRVFVFNISDVVGDDNMNKIKAWNKRKIPLPAYFIQIFEDCGFTYVDDIIWDKGEVQSSRHKNKSRPYPFYQYPINCYEHILIFHKHRLDKDTKYPCSDCGSLNVKSNSYTMKGLRSWECMNSKCKKSESNRGKRFSLKTIIVQDPKRCSENIIYDDTIDLWRKDIHSLTPVIKINSKGKNKLGHTAPFPSEIPEMAIKYFSYKNDIVLDMFGGSQTTAIAANKLNRIGLGCELRKDLFEKCIMDNFELNSVNANIVNNISKK